MPEPLPVELDAIDPAPAPNAAVRLEIQSPRLGQRIAQNRVGRTPVKLALRGAGPNHRLQVQLDAHAPREVGPAGGIALRELIPEEMTFEPGLHSLHAFIVDERGVSLKPAVEHTVLPYATVQFWIGEGDGTTSAVSEPSIVYLLPRGTYNGAAAADSAVLDFYLFNTRLDADEHRVKVDVSSGGRSRQFVLSEWRAWRIAGLPSGDYRVELTLVDASNEPVQSPVSRVITVNRDAPEDPAP
jgi:hypothetical protein